MSKPYDSDDRLIQIEDQAVEVFVAEAAPLADASAPRPVTPENGSGSKQMDTKILLCGTELIDDEQIIEMLICFASPHADSKHLARQLLTRFGTYSGILAATKSQLLEFQELGDRGVSAIKLIHASAARFSRAKVLNQPILANWDNLISYLNGLFLVERTEHIRLLFLDARNHLLADEPHTQGTVNQASVYPREVVRRALEVHATALILVHNHPSGDPTPSNEDVKMTMAIEAALRTVSIELHDHVIIGNGCWTSIRKEGLI